MSEVPSATVAFNGITTPTVPPVGWKVIAAAAVAEGANARDPAAMVAIDANPEIKATAWCLNVTRVSLLENRWM
jgi:hypothetical protein